MSTNVRPSARLRARISGRDIISRAVSLCGGVLLFAALIILRGDTDLLALSLAQRQSLSLMSLQLDETAYAVNLMPKGFGDELFPWILLPVILGEGALAIWLLVVGVNSTKWNAVAAARTT